MKNNALEEHHGLMAKNGKGEWVKLPKEMTLGGFIKKVKRDIDQESEAEADHLINTHPGY